MKKIIFLTGTRADFGKLKSLIEQVQNSDEFTSYAFVTGMHLLKIYGYTLIEVQRAGIENITTFDNHTSENTMDLTLARTIEGFSNFVKSIKPDLIVIHGDRVEALAGAIVGSLNNVLVAHIEGGEVSGTIDELIRHATTKMSHIHFVANDLAKKRLVQMGELPSSVFIIGSPDIDLMFSDKLPNLTKAKNHYNIDFQNFAIVLFHPVTTEVEKMKEYTRSFVNALLKSDKQYIVVYPNNDLGSRIILEEYKKLESNKNFKVFPSLRFEYFLVLLKYADFIVGNSSAGIREAPYYGIPTIDIGTRQSSRAMSGQIINVSYNEEDILEAINQVSIAEIEATQNFGKGDSAQRFIESLIQLELWQINKQKQFRDV